MPQVVARFQAKFVRPGLARQAAGEYIDSNRIWAFFGECGPTLLRKNILLATSKWISSLFSWSDFRSEKASFRPDP